MNDRIDCLATVEEKQYGMSTPDWRQQFGYDRFGNRSMGTGSTQTFGRNLTETQALIGADPAVSASTNRITNRTGELYEFDASGNMTKDALGNRSVYDIENHQIEYYYSTNTGSTPDAKYYYDGDGKRIKKVVSTETTVFVYDAGGKLAAEYTLGVTANPSPQTNYISTDMLGSTRIVTNGIGQVVARHDYLPFGDEIYGLGGRTSAQGFSQPDSTRQRFTGYEHDTETGLDFAQARYYGNGLGRFTGVDPLLESAKLSAPQSWNRYIYTINNPLIFVDPSGLFKINPKLLPEQQDAIMAGYRALKDSLSKHKVGSRDYNRILRALTELGEPDEDNGVEITIGKTRSPKAGAQTDPAEKLQRKTKFNETGQLIIIMFNEANFSGKSANELAGMLGHEAIHASDFTNLIKAAGRGYSYDGIYAGFNKIRYDSEFEAFSTQGAVAQGLEPNEPFIVANVIVRTIPGVAYLPFRAYLWNPLWVTLPAYFKEDVETLRGRNIKLMLHAAKDDGGYGLPRTK